VGNLEWPRWVNHARGGKGGGEKLLRETIRDTGGDCGVKPEHHTGEGESPLVNP